jgi:cobalt/nickel-transporting P-type ATPase D
MPGSQEKTGSAIAVACLVAAISAALLLHRRRRRSSSPRIEGKRARERRCSDPVMYKPQEKFKRVLADNSSSPFKHLKHEAEGG